MDDSDDDSEGTQYAHDLLTDFEECSGYEDWEEDEEEGKEAAENEAKRARR